MGGSQSNGVEATDNVRNERISGEFRDEDFEGVDRIIRSELQIATMEPSNRDENKTHMKLLRRLFTKLDPEITATCSPTRNCGCVDLAFKKKENLLMVKVIRANDLDPMDMRSVSADAYVKLYVMYDGIKVNECYQTRVVYNSLKPTFNEIFSFSLADVSKDYTLKVEVWDYDRLTHDDFLGETSFNIGSIDTEQQDTYYLHDKIDISISGSIKVKVTHHLPCRLSVQIVSAQDIGKNDGRLPSTFIAVEIPESETGIQQTEVIHNDDNPEWNQQFIFNVSVEEFNLRKVFFNVIEYTRMGRNHSLGGAILPLNLLNSESTLDNTINLQDTKSLHAANTNKSVLTQEYREALIAHAQISLPTFIFTNNDHKEDGGDRVSVAVAVACPRSIAANYHYAFCYHLIYLSWPAINPVRFRGSK